jgi:hypothetical protein
MPQPKRSRSRTGLSAVHPAAGDRHRSTMHVAAVGSDRDTEPAGRFRLSPMTFIGWRLVRPRGKNGRHQAQGSTGSRLAY